MDEPRILLVGRPDLSPDAIGPALGEVLPEFEIQSVSEYRDALAEMERGGVAASLMFLDGPQAENQIAEVLQAIQARDFSVPVFVFTFQEDVYQRLRMLELGALDCLAWPVDVTRLAALIDVLSVRDRHAASVHPAQPNSAPQPSLREVAGFLFATRSLCAMYDQIEAAADSQATILLTGETGTGKSHVARAIHNLSPRRKRPFVVVECGGLSPTLLDSELFGHVRGAFTGADREHVGKFTTVEDGTILLDEIDCVPLEAQAKLLRVFEDRVYEPLGSNRTATFQARVIAATNQPLDRLVAEGKFRSDLFFRLNVVEFCLPPLRECREAIVPLAESFLTTYCQRTQRSIDGIAFEALDAMLAYDWPGNIRELRNTIERAVTLCRREALDLIDLPASVRDAAARAGHAVPAAVRSQMRNELDSARQHGERQRIVQALTRHGNNRTRAAKELGISRVALYKKLHKFGLATSPT